MLLSVPDIWHFDHQTVTGVPDIRHKRVKLINCDLENKFTFQLRPAF